MDSLCNIEGWIDVKNISNCPECGYINNTTGRLCVFCSLIRKLRLKRGHNDSTQEDKARLEVIEQRRIVRLANIKQEHKKKEK